MANTDREYIKSQVLRVFQEWGVPPSGRGSGVGDFEYWIDVIQDIHNERPAENRGWESYWEESRMPRAFEEAGYRKLSDIPADLPPANPAPTSGDVYLVILARLEGKIDLLTSKLARYF
jgi:hypothetical protein